MTASPIIVQHSSFIVSLRAWLFLVLWSLRRQAQARQMIWIALILLGLCSTVVALITAADRMGPNAEAAFANFSQAWVFTMVIGFLLPIWSLSFATQALGGEREGRTLVWLLTRPLSRPSVYLAKFLAVLPWSLGLNLGGFSLLCLAGGAAGRRALDLYWPAVFWGTLAYCALFHLMGACLRRPAVVAIVYTFFFETFVGSLPGTMKRISISFYAGCQMFEVANKYGIKPPQEESIYVPVRATTAMWVLAGVTALLLAVGALAFSRLEYQDDT